MADSTQDQSSPKPAQSVGLSALAQHAPPLPHTLFEAVELMERPDDLDVRRVQMMVRHDPVVVARLLKIVNSAYYGMHRTVDDVGRAVVLLGPVTVTGIVMGMNMLKLSPAVTGAAADCFKRVIRHSLAVAHLARMIDHFRLGASASGDAGSAFTAGLLHDFGKILLIYNEPEAAASLYDRPNVLDQFDEPDVRALEQLTFGYDHTEAGEFVARKLDFPDALVNVIRHHHEPADCPRTAVGRTLVSIVSIADSVSRAMGFSLEQPLSWKDCAALPALKQVMPSRGSELLSHLQAEQEHLITEIDRIQHRPAPRRAPRVIPEMRSRRRRTGRNSA